MSPCEKMQIGNDIHFDLEGHIVVKLRFCDLRLCLKVILMVIYKYSRSPPVNKCQGHLFPVAFE